MRYLVTIALSLSFSGIVSAQSLETLQFGPQNEQSGNAVDVIVAVVGDDVITEAEISNYSKNNLSREQILDSLILRKILLAEANRFNIVVNDTTINVALEQILADSGRSLDSLTNEESRQLREQIREDLTISRLQENVLRQNVKVSDKEIDSLMERNYKNLDERVKLVDILIPISNKNDANNSSQLQLTLKNIDETLKKSGFKAVQSNYPDAKVNNLGWVELKGIPPRFAKVLVDVKKGEYAKPITDDDGIHILQVIDREGEQAQQVAVTETKAQHILIRDDGSNDSETRIKSIYQQIQQGANFSEVAINYSQDYASAAKGGDLGWVVPGQTVREFEDAMNKTPVNGVSEPVKSSFGWHIIKVNERRAVDTSNKETLRQQAYQSLFSQRAEQTWNLWIQQVRDQAFIEIRK